MGHNKFLGRVETMKKIVALVVIGVVLFVSADGFALKILKNAEKMWIHKFVKTMDHQI